MPGIQATIGADARPFAGQIQLVERMAARAGQNIAKGLGGGHAGAPNTFVMRETLVLLREISRGNWTRAPGSLSLLLSRMGALKYLFSATAAAVVGLGAAMYLLTRHFLQAAREARNLADLMDITRTKFTDLAAQMKNSAEAAQAQADWLTHLGDKQESLADKTEDAIKALREQAKLEREIASRGGASASRLAQMDIQTAKAELAALQQGIEAAVAKGAADKAAEESAAARRSAPEYAERGSRLANAQGHLRDLGEVADAIQEKMARTLFTDYTKQVSPGFGGSGGIQPQYGQRNATDQDVFSVKVGGKDYKMSLAEAKANFEKLAAESAAMEKTQKDIDDLLQEKKKLTERDVDDLNRLMRLRDDQQRQVDIDSKLLPSLAAMKGRREHGLVNSLQRIGAYTPPAVVVDVAKQQLKELRGINSNTSRIGGGAGALLGKVRY